MKYVILLSFLLLSFITSCEETEAWEEQKIIYPAIAEVSDTIDREVEYDIVVCSFEKYMDLKPAVYSAQGSTCYGDYFVQGYNYNDCITIYNLKEKKMSWNYRYTCTSTKF